MGERGGSVVECRTPEREVGGSKPTAAVLCPWARHFTPRKYWLITQEAVAPSRHDWKIVDWDVKPQHKQTNIGSDYRKIVDLEKRMEQGVLHRMAETGRYCLPDFVKKEVNIWFAVDNIDLLEDTQTGQNTFHSTVIVMQTDSLSTNPLLFQISSNLGTTCVWSQVSSRTGNN